MRPATHSGERRGSVLGSTRTALLLSLLALVFGGVLGLVWWSDQSDSPSPPLAGVLTTPSPIATVPTKAAGDAARLNLPLPAPVAPEDLGAAQRLADAADHGVLTVVVLDFRGAPVPGAAVALWPPGASPRGDIALSHQNPLSLATTDESGRCTVATTAADQQILAEHVGFGSSGLWTVAEARERLTQEGLLPLTLEWPATIKGIVLHADGRPAAGAFVRFVDVPRSQPGGRSRQQWPVPAGSDGSFTLRLERAGSGRVRAWADDATTQSGVLTVDTQTLGDVVLRFDEPLAIHGTVLNPAGEPVANATITWWQERAGAASSVPLVSSVLRSADDGRFALARSRPGSYTLVAAAQGFAPSEVQQVQLVEQQSALQEGLTLTLLQPAHISGSLHWETGAPIPGMEVVAEAAGRVIERLGDSALNAETLFGKATAVTDRDGRFELSTLSPLASYRVSCDLDSGRAYETGDWDRRRRILVEPEVPAGTQELRLIASAWRLDGIPVAGRILDALTQQPADRLSLHLVNRFDDDNADYSARHPVLGDDGRFVLEGLVPGERYALGATGWLGDVQLAYGRTDWFTASESLDEVVLALPRMGTLVVRVIDAGGAPVRNVVISADWQDGKSNWASLFSNEHGRAIFKPAAPGHYRITAEKDGRRTELFTEVASGERHDVPLLWPPDS